MLKKSLLITTVAILAAAPAAAQDANAIYKPDMKFGEVFGRPIDLRRADGSQIFDPTLADVERAGVTSPAVTYAQDAIKGLRASVAAANPACKDMLSLKLPWVKIQSAEDVAAKDGVRAYCKVLGVIDTEINFEVDMPLSNEWNGKYLMGGNGGFLGNLINLTQTSTLARAYAIAITDTGHLTPKDAGASWAHLNPERLANFGHRGTHLGAVNAKLVIQAYYNKAVKYSYYFGQSGSGRTAMMEAQRYPEDFDGIVAACPAFNWTTGVGASFAWTQQAMFKTSQDEYEYRPVVPANKIPALSKAVYAKCDANDGLKDEVITDPLSCKFDPLVDLKICKSGEDSAECFTKEQAEVIKKIHDGPSNSAGKVWSSWVYGGETIPGQWISEPGGTAYVIGAPKANVATASGMSMDVVRGAFSPYRSRHYLLGNETLRWLVHDNPEYDLHDFNFETDLAALIPAAAQIDANDPDMSGMKKRGAKLIMGIGWDDWCCNAVSLKEYYDRAAHKMGGMDQVQSFAKLFFLPGVGHCFSSEPSRKTTNYVDYLTALEQWVEQGKEPLVLTAAHATGKIPAPDGIYMPAKAQTLRTRPICAYPAQTVYKGSGNIDDAANFTCKAP